MLITVQPNPSWQLSLAQLSPSLYIIGFFLKIIPFFGYLSNKDEKGRITPFLSRLQSYGNFKFGGSLFSEGNLPL